MDPKGALPANGIPKQVSSTQKPRAVPPHAYPTRSLEFLRDLQCVPETNYRSRCALRIIIVGAGVGGLATSIALALSNADHQIQVLEQAPALAEVGAGIQLPSNTTKLLTRWGVMPHLKSNLVRPYDIRFRRWQDGSLVGKTPLTPEFEATFGAGYYVIHRAHLHSGMHARAVELGVRVRVGSKVVEYAGDRETSVRLENGEVLTSDLVVAADGVKSLAREVVTGLKGLEKPTGYAAYRATVDFEKMKERGLDEILGDAPGLNIWIGDQRHVMTYLISDGRSFNMVLSHRNETDPRRGRRRTCCNG